MIAHKAESLETPNHQQQNIFQIDVYQLGVSVIVAPEPSVAEEVAASISFVSATPADQELNKFPLHRCPNVLVVGHIALRKVFYAS